MLQENSNPTWTKADLEHFQKYGETCYAEHVDPEKWQNEYRRIEEGEPTRLVPNDVRVFDIHEEQQVVGHVSLSPCGEAEYEVVISIFDAFAGKGYAKCALKELIHLFKQSGHHLKFSAVVQKQNPNRDKMISILRSVGFEAADEGNPALNSVMYLYL